MIASQTNFMGSEPNRVRLARPAKVIIALLFVVAGLNVHCGGSQTSSSEHKSANFEIALTESGELRAVNSRVISVPSFRYEFSNNGRAKIVWLEEEGKLVSKGDVVARFDTSTVKRVREQKEADLDIAYADLEKSTIQQEGAMRDLGSELRIAQTALKRAEIDLRRVQYEPKTSQEIARLKLRISEVEVDKLRTKIKHKKVIHREERFVLEANIRRIRSTIVNADRVIEIFALRAPEDGMVKHEKNWQTREKVRVGEDVWQGLPLVSLPNLSQMKVQTTVNEKDISKVSIGQRVEVRLDAYPKVAFEGQISAISVTCRKKEEKSKIKVFDLEILLDKADPILKPGMTVSCDIFAPRT